MTVLSGKVRYRGWGDGEAWYVGSAPVAKIIESFAGKQVYAAYAFAPEYITGERLLAIAINQMDGLADGELQGNYSEITGYLWTDEGASIGGHNILDIFSAHEKEYGCLVIKEHPIDLEEIGTSWEDELEDGERRSYY